MSNIRVATRYASALFQLAKEKGLQAEIAENAKQFIHIAEQNRDFVIMLRSPLIYPEKKARVLKSIFEDQLNDVVYSFMDIVLRKRREAALVTIFECYLAMYMTSQGKMEASVTTATAISDEVYAELKSYISKRTGLTIDLSTKLNPEIIGGFVVRYEDKVIDASVATRLKALEAQLSNNN